ncbi:flavin reductase family protein [Candidatus Woesearchaeota archaeon]|nr:flavin reductase family protein [Candidatus Woesearchaeota archaeon]
MAELTSPRQTILVTSRYSGKDNIIALSWHAPVSFTPELYAIMVGHTRFSHDLIKNSKVFCVNFMSIEHEKEVLACGTSSGRSSDKFEKAGLTKGESEKIDCPRIKEALGYLECKVVNAVKAGDHTIFVGEVVNSESKKKGKRILQDNGGFTTTK